jgi:hypothetical protein
MFAVLLRFTLFIYLYIGFLSRVRHWTVAVTQLNLLVKIQYI